MSLIGAWTYARRMSLVHVFVSTGRFASDELHQLTCAAPSPDIDVFLDAETAGCVSAYP
jgi:hypothetical protein